MKLLRELLESLDDVVPLRVVSPSWSLLRGYRVQRSSATLCNEVSLRGNRLQRRSSERFAACVHALTGYKAVLLDVCGKGPERLTEATGRRQVLAVLSRHVARILKRQKQHVGVAMSWHTSCTMSCGVATPTVEEYYR